ncbi:MAG: amidohydrolase [Anaerolineaceae bacterium]|nr:amidohydrolase [Anaerolineaceae bacterium]
MKIDVHTHYTPPSIKDNLKDFAEKEPYWGLLITPDPVNHTEQGWATAEQMIADMDKAGVDKVVLLGEGQTRHENAVERHNIGIEIMRSWPDRVISFAAVQPKEGQKAVDELKRCIDAGMSGMGEMGHYSGGFRFDDPDFLRLVETCIDLDVPINLHCNEEVGHFYLGKSIYPLRHYYQLISRYPEMKLILAHWGGGILFYEIMPEVRRTLKNVYYDSAGGPLVFPTDGIFKAALHLIDHKKILYGSDYPLIICPDIQTSPDFRPFIQEIDALGLDREVYDDIMGNNAARLFGFLEGEPENKSEFTGVKEYEAASPIITELANVQGVKPSQFMAVSLVAHTWPKTRAVFEKYGIPWVDSPTPFWEPIAQAAAARGYGPKIRQKILDELGEAALEQG